MRDFRRLPLFLRGLAIVGLLFSVVSILMLLAMFVLFIVGGLVLRQELANDHRVFAIALNLSLLSLACGFAVNRYRTRLRQQNGWRFPLDSWQRQARATALLAALPLCAIALAVVSPPTQDASFLVIFLISLFGAFVLIGSYLQVAAG